MSNARAGRAFVLCALLLSSSACTSDRPASGRHGTLTVFAASSLKEPFEALSASFAAAGGSGARIELNLAGSQHLRAQLESGARADVVATADERHMAALRAKGVVDTPQVFACNRLVVVVPAANPAGLKAADELDRAQRIVLAAPEVPAGHYADEALQRMSAGTSGADAGFAQRVTARVVSRELNVRQVLSKVALGEADAAIVYRSDALSAGDKVLTLELPAHAQVVARYPVAVVSETGARALASAFIAHLEGPAGREALRRAGFSECPPEPGR